MSEQYIQIGVTALRAPDGSFLPAVPLYIKATPEKEAAEQKLIQDIGGVLAAKFKQYLKETGKTTTETTKTTEKERQNNGTGRDQSDRGQAPKPDADPQGHPETAQCEHVNR